MHPLQIYHGSNRHAGTLKTWLLVVLDAVVIMVVTVFQSDASLKRYNKSKSSTFFTFGTKRLL